MSEVRYSNIAAKIAGYMSLFWGIGIVTGWLLMSSLSGNGAATLAILAFPFAFLVDFLALRIVLPKACRQYGLTVRKDSASVAIKGGALLGLAWGLMWRLSAVSIPINLLQKALVSSDSSPFVLLFTFFGFFLASLWLLKHQIGGTTISKQDADVTYEHQIQEVVVKEVTAVQAAKEGTTAILTTAAVLSYFAVGLVQIGAVVAFFHDYWGWWYIPSILVAPLIAYTPLVGAAAGMYAAIKVWDWAWYWAGLLFFFPIVLGVMGMGVAGVVGLISSKFGRR